MNICIHRNSGPPNAPAPLALHGVHAASPCPLLAVPEGHVWHTAPLRVKPGMHTHAALPTVMAFSEVPHAWHCGSVPPGPNEPTGHA